MNSTLKLDVHYGGYKPMLRLETKDINQLMSWALIAHCIVEMTKSNRKLGIRLDMLSNPSLLNIKEFALELGPQICNILYDFEKDRIKVPYDYKIWLTDHRGVSTKVDPSLFEEEYETIMCKLYNLPLIYSPRPS